MQWRISASSFGPVGGGGGTGTLAWLRCQPWGRPTSRWSTLLLAAHSASHSSSGTYRRSCCRGGEGDVSTGARAPRNPLDEKQHAVDTGTREVGEPPTVAGTEACCYGAAA
jgi:hypothetical protein